jgi:hypothetical protein
MLCNRDRNGHNVGVEPTDIPIPAARLLYVAGL